MLLYKAFLTALPIPLPLACRQVLNSIFSFASMLPLQLASERSVSAFSHRTCITSDPMVPMSVAHRFRPHLDNFPLRILKSLYYMFLDLPWTIFTSVD